MNYTEKKDLTHVSVSQVELYKECPRKHYYQYVLGNRQESTKAQEYGKKCHDILERFLNGEISKEEISKIKYHGATVMVGLDELPKVDNPFVEEKFELMPSDLKSKVLGFIDYFHIEEDRKRAILIDHKVVKSDQYILDSGKLFNKNQIIVYAKFIIDTYNVDTVEAYYYYYKRGGHWLKKVKTVLSQEDINEKYKNFINSAIDCEDNYSKELTETVQHLNSCQKWAGCPFKDECWGAPKMSQGKSFFETLQEISESNETAETETETESEDIFESIANSDEKEPTALISSETSWGSFINPEESEEEYIDTTVDDEVHLGVEDEFEKEFHDLSEEEETVITEREEMNIFSESIENFSLSNRTRNSLTKSGFSTLSDAFMYISENNTFEMYCRGEISEDDFRTVVETLKAEVKGFGASCVDDLINNINTYNKSQADVSSERVEGFEEYNSEMSSSEWSEKAVLEVESEHVESVQEQDAEQVSINTESQEDTEQVSALEAEEKIEQESDKEADESSEEESGNDHQQSRILLIGSTAIKGLDQVMLEDVLHTLEQKIQEENKVPHLAMLPFNKGYDQLAGVVSLMSWEELTGASAIHVSLTASSTYSKVLTELVRKAEIVISRT